jgi:drug/metabolite transporter (DMT)-like permease
LAIHSTTSAVIFTVLALVTGEALPPATPTFWIATTWLILLPTLGGYGLYWILLTRIGVTPVNTLMFLMAPVVSVWGALMFGEPFTLMTAAGLAIGLVTVLMVAVPHGDRVPDSGR